MVRMDPMRVSTGPYQTGQHHCNIFIIHSLGIRQSSVLVLIISQVDENGP